jgi:hypothetical protein
MAKTTGVVPLLLATGGLENQQQDALGLATASHLGCLGSDLLKVLPGQTLIRMQSTLPIGVELGGQWIYIS